MNPIPSTSSWIFVLVLAVLSFICFKIGSLTNGGIEMKSSIGRIVLVKPEGFDQPRPAIITMVWDDGMVNVCAFDCQGKGAFACTSVGLVDSPEDLAPGKWCWPPKV